MLAYVLWHVARAGVGAREYEAAHHAFHDVLWATGVPGFIGLRVYALPAIPWLASPAPGYEDWHLLESSAAMDRLNEAAITNARQLPHDRIAALADEGIAGLYGLRAGRMIEPSVAYWLAKPAGMRYAEFDRSLAPFVERGCCLWSRRMTLGPTPEFCLHAPGEISLPYPARAIGMALKYRRAAG